MELTMIAEVVYQNNFFDEVLGASVQHAERENIWNLRAIYLS